MATLTIEVSTSSSTAASVTAMAIRYLYLYLSASGAAGGRPTNSCAVPRGPAPIWTDSFSATSVPLISVHATRRASTLALRRGVDVHDRRHARAQRTLRRRLAADADSHGHALNDFGEIARGVIGRQQRELGSGRRAHALNAAPHVHTRTSVDLDIDWLADAQGGELRFLEVGRDVHPGVRDDRQQRLTGLHELPTLGL